MPDVDRPSSAGRGPRPPSDPPPFLPPLPPDPRDRRHQATSPIVDEAAPTPWYCPATAEDGQAEELRTSEVGDHGLAVDLVLDDEDLFSAERTAPRLTAAGFAEGRHDTATSRAIIDDLEGVGGGLGVELGSDAPRAAVGVDVTEGHDGVAATSDQDEPSGDTTDAASPESDVQGGRAASARAARAPDADARSDGWSDEDSRGDEPSGDASLLDDEPADRTDPTVDDAGEGAERRSRRRRSSRPRSPRHGSRRRRSTAAGPRVRQQRARRRAALLRRLSAAGGGVLGVALVALLFLVVGPRVVATVQGWSGGDDESVASQPADGAAGGAGIGAARTVLVATLDEATGQRATDIQLLTVDVDDRVEAIVMVPASTITDVPGYGLISLGDAGGLGGVPLLELTIENALDIGVDATVEMTRSSWTSLFGRTGPVDVTVPAPVDVAAADGTVERRFEPGRQSLDGPRLAELLTVDAAGESELVAMSRTQLVIEAYLDGAAGGLDVVFEDDAPMLSSSDVAVTEEVLRALAAARTDGRLDVLTLPVEPVGGGDELVYRLDERSRALAEEMLGAGLATAPDAGARVRLEVLNGNGRVGVGAEVAELLVPLGHQIVITRNADSFDQEETLVTVREDDPAVLAAAREIVETLGVGRVSVSGIPSTTVDISIVVGADWQG